MIDLGNGDLDNLDINMKLSDRVDSKAHDGLHLDVAIRESDSINYHHFILSLVVKKI